MCTILSQSSFCVQKNSINHWQYFKFSFGKWVKAMVRFIVPRKAAINHLVQNCAFSFTIIKEKMSPKVPNCINKILISSFLLLYFWWSKINFYIVQFKHVFLVLVDVFYRCQCFNLYYVTGIVWILIVEIPLISVISRNLINHWMMVLEQFKDPVCCLYLAASVIAALALTQGVTGLNNTLTYKYLLLLNSADQPILTLIVRTAFLNVR